MVPPTPLRRRAVLRAVPVPVLPTSGQQADQTQRLQLSSLLVATCRLGSARLGSARRHGYLKGHLPECMSAAECVEAGFGGEEWCGAGLGRWGRVGPAGLVGGVVPGFDVPPSLRSVNRHEIGREQARAGESRRVYGWGWGGFGMQGSKFLQLVALCLAAWSGVTKGVTPGPTSTSLCSAPTPGRREPRLGYLNCRRNSGPQCGYSACCLPRGGARADRGGAGRGVAWWGGPRP